MSQFGMLFKGEVEEIIVWFQDFAEGDDFVNNPFGAEFAVGDMRCHRETAWFQQVDMLPVFRESFGRGLQRICPVWLEVRAKFGILHNLKIFLYVVVNLTTIFLQQRCRWIPRTTANHAFSRLNVNIVTAKLTLLSTGVNSAGIDVDADMGFIGCLVRREPRVAIDAVVAIRR